jgi:hypothetical protein
VRQSNASTHKQLPCSRHNRSVRVHVDVAQVYRPIGKETLHLESTAILHHHVVHLSTGIGRSGDVTNGFESFNHLEFVRDSAVPSQYACTIVLQYG